MYHLLNHFRLYNTAIRYTSTQRTNCRVGSGMECLGWTLCWSGRTCGTVRDDMTLLFAIVVNLLTAAASNMSKLFSRKTLDLSHITTLSSALSSICNCHGFGTDSIMRHSSLSNQTLFFPEKFTNTSIQRRNRIPI